MNARLAALESEGIVNQLLESSKEMAKRLAITVEQAIDKKVAVYVKYAKTVNEACAWEIRGERAKKLLNK